VSKPVIPEDLKSAHDYGTPIERKLIERIGRVEQERDRLRNSSLDREELEFTHELMNNLGLVCVDPSQQEWKVLKAKTWINKRAEDAARERDEANLLLSVALSHVRELEFKYTQPEEQFHD
jgi:hypothetical protein